MANVCPRSCGIELGRKADSTGARAAFYYTGGGTYKGYWLHNKEHRYGVKETKAHLIYDGQWQHGKRHGRGTMRRRLPDGTQERIYVGEWHNDMKCGEGKQFYAQGTYYGWWWQNRRHGLGVMWYKDGSMYVGEWEADVYHGLGVHFYANGNRYEGHHARGYKNGEGTFYHMHTGQLQKGVWENDVCKASIVMDDFRHQADSPTQWPIPKIGLVLPEKFVCEIFQKYLKNANKPHLSLKGQKCLNFVHKVKQFTRFEPKAISKSLLEFDIKFPCPCKPVESQLIL